MTSTYKHNMLVQKKSRFENGNCGCRDFNNELNKYNMQLFTLYFLNSSKL